MIDWDKVFSWISALGPWVTGMAVAWIAIWQLKSQKQIADRQHELEQRIADRQAKLDEDKLRLELFEKRFAVYRALVDKIRVPNANSETGREIHDRFWERLLEARYLFGQDVNRYLGEVWTKSISLSVIEDKPPSDERKRDLWMKEVGELQSWFYPQFENPDVISMFQQYINFSTISRS